MIAAAATSHKQVAAAHSEGAGDAIVATSLPREADVAAELLLAVKRRADPSPKAGRPDKPKENQPGIDKHNDVPDKKPKEGNKQGTS